MMRLEYDASTLARLCRAHGVRELAVFGSHARAEAGPASDVDLLVEFEPGTSVGFVALSRLRRELEALFGRSVDLVTKRGLKPLIRGEVLASTHVLYAA